jgi:uncharacterized protein with HEPN domain
VSHDWRLYLDDIAECAGRVIEYTRGMSYDEFIQDPRTCDATLRNLEIIGEAAKRVPADAQQRYPQVPWREISRFRDRLAHGYRTLDYTLIWATIQQDVEPLLREVKGILAIEDHPPGAR